MECWKFRILRFNPSFHSSIIPFTSLEIMPSWNKELINLYWDIGKAVVERKEKFGWGRGIVEQLSRDLTNEYANFEWFSRDNLWRMRMFYLAYEDHAKLAQVVPVLPWGHNVERMELQGLLVYDMKN